MKKPKTYVVLIVDKSGSMIKIRQQTIDWFNEQVQQLKLNSDDDQDISVSLVTFNAAVFEHLWDSDVKELQEFGPSDFVPEGGTSMRDAIGYALQKLLTTTDPNEENVSYLVKVVSDGETNSDQHYKIRWEQDGNTSYTVDPLKMLIEGFQETKKLTISYMGCDERYLQKIAKETGVPLANTAKFAATGELAKAGYDLERRKSQDYFEGRKRGVTATSNYMSTNDSCLADFSKGNDEQLSISSVVSNSPVSEEVAPAKTWVAPKNLAELAQAVPSGDAKQLNIQEKGEYYQRNSRQVTWKV